MHFIYSLLLLVFPHYTLASVDPKNVRCLVCQSVVEEIDSVIQKVDPKRTMEVGSYRLDSMGNQKQKTVSYARSEMHLTEVLETICNKMDDYVRATYKTSGELTLLRLIGADGQMNPDLSHVDIIQDSDLNKSLKFYCEGIVEEYEENILRLFGRDADNIDIKLCSNEANLCSHSESDADDYEFEDRDEL
ncbi:protein seele [Zootermopsis nevadensis]|nr:protein seele [Zootermopsis nevadensis]XP_021916711.1 protein seele [Zootermopsis nevadensis]XP_021916712.1 protein seele [Zootermopsis nevadensis]XP_021916713.1 protein seele [Zootermopsis nevadensis]XP_021916714.1 protein seele [Zootermopsis nevadensis]XP_021916715.1 protein seele [Zootermopsis nevadensis]